MCYLVTKPMSDFNQKEPTATKAIAYVIERFNDKKPTKRQHNKHIRHTTTEVFYSPIKAENETPRDVFWARRSEEKTSQNRYKENANASNSY